MDGMPNGITFAPKDFRVLFWSGEDRMLDLSEENPKQLDPAKVRSSCRSIGLASNDEELHSRIADSIEAALWKVEDARSLLT